MSSLRKAPLDPEAIRRMHSSNRCQGWRAGILRNEPSCRACAEAGFTVATEHIDHIEPAHLAPERFWDRDNIQRICRQCPRAQARRRSLYT